MKLIECSVEGLTAYLKTLAADDPKVQMVELLLEELKAKQPTLPYGVPPTVGFFFWACRGWLVR